MFDFWFLILLLLYVQSCESMFFSSDHFKRDCLHYYLMDSVTPTKAEHCLRPINNSRTVLIDFVNTRDQNYTFDELHRMNTNAYDILSWSSSIDLAERYQYFLEQKNDSILSTELFYNCTKPWFGDRCQYSFELNDSTFEIKQTYAQLSSVGNVTCYTLLECNRGGTFMCLDWREICDGRIDCLNGGVDEAQCFSLEINECEDNQYRCRNGLCISEEAWKYEYFTAECLDQSDIQNNIVCPNSDSKLDLFKCEENTCRSDKNMFSCGDGQCVEDFEECSNGRHIMLIRSMSIQGNLSYTCWNAMICLTKMIDIINETFCQEFFQSSHVINYLHSCNDLIQFPVMPVVFGHIRFLYRPKTIDKINNQYVLLPDYICYDEKLCDFLKPTFRTDSYACLDSHESIFQSQNQYFNWKSLVDIIKSYFHGCTSGYYRKFDPKHTSLYRCRNSSKYISRHRIADNTSDCYLNDDEENIESNCSNDVTCHAKYSNEIKSESLSSSFFNDHYPPINEDNQNLDNILFHQICDRIIDRVPVLINEKNHTDETDCEHWPCNNIYTRCDGFWNCPNGEDEVNCEQSRCPRYFLNCFSPYNYTQICLPAIQINDGIIDCLGGLDELQLCQISSYNSGISYRYHCLNYTKCIEFSDICNLQRDCPLNDDEIFCENSQNVYDTSISHSYSDILSSFGYISTRRRFPFIIETSPIYPDIKSIVTENQVSWPIEAYTPIDSVIPTSNNSNLSSYCIRGILVYRWLGNQNYVPICFCPPNYYGPMCQYQNQRVSLTLTLSTANKFGAYAIIVKLVDDDNDRQQVNSYDQLIYIPKTSCRQLFNTYLLYLTRPNNISNNYSIHIDFYDKISMEYRASWYLKVPFTFLPVNRLAATLALATYRIDNENSCPLECKNGRCIKYMNEEKFFCQCKSGWSGFYCHIPIDCSDCSFDSICIDIILNRSICLCPPNKFGSRCLLRHSCPINYCKNNGQCIVVNERLINDSYICLCSEEFDGERCENLKATLEMSLYNIESSSHLFVYIYSSIYSEPPLLFQMILQKLTLMQNKIILYFKYLYQMVFVKINGYYYLAVVQHKDIFNSSTLIDTNQRCYSIDELLPVEQLELPRIQRVKYYHIPCQNDINLKCFYDESYMCLCTADSHANCFIFDHDMNFLCQQQVHCQNGGQCLQDHPICPFTTICICTDCFFGDRCQYYAKGIGLTLDDMLRYEIRPNVNLSCQTRPIKVSAMLTMMLFIIGLFNSIFSLLAFKSQNSRKAGCGMYLLASSITSILTVTMLIIKFWFVVLTQMNSSVPRWILRIGCLLIEPILKLFLCMDNWLNACVAIERTVNVFKGVHFNKSTSKRVARLVIIFLPFLIIASNIYESIFRDLFDDYEERRVWCVTLYSQSIHTYNTIILFFHFLTPFCVNLFSAVFIIFTIARQRSFIRTHKSYNQHLREQFYLHKQLIISPMILVILSLPILIISLLSGCVKTSRNSWLYLSGYFISFIPSATVFIVFVLPSELYWKEFKQSIKNWQRLISRN